MQPLHPGSDYAARVSEFFEPPPPPPGPRSEIREAPHRHWMGPTRGTVPGVVPAERVIARTDDLAVSLSCLWVYPAGFKFDVFVDLRDEGSDLDPFLIDRHSRGKDEQLLLGFEFADGAKATNMREDWGRGLESGSPLLVGKGASRSGGHSCQSFWLWPLPAPGRLEIVCEWPEAGTPLTRSALDSGAIVEAASRAQTIFADSREALK
jgi:hypothetical protein